MGIEFAKFDGMLRTRLGILTLTLCVGCAWVDLTSGGKDVKVASVDQIRHCEHLGSGTGTTKDRVGFIARGKETVQGEVERLARNQAAIMGGDTIVPTGPVVNGSRTYKVYRCRRGKA